MIQNAALEMSNEDLKRRLAESEARLGLANGQLESLKSREEEAEQWYQESGRIGKLLDETTQENEALCERIDALDRENERLRECLAKSEAKASQLERQRDGVRCPVCIGGRWPGENCDACCGTGWREEPWGYEKLQEDWDEENEDLNRRLAEAERRAEGLEKAMDLQVTENARHLSKLSDLIGSLNDQLFAACVDQDRLAEAELRLGMANSFGMEDGTFIYVEKMEETPRRWVVWHKLRGYLGSRGEWYGHDGLPSFDTRDAAFTAYDAWRKKQEEATYG